MTAFTIPNIIINNYKYAALVVFTTPIALHFTYDADFIRCQFTKLLKAGKIYYNNRTISIFRELFFTEFCCGV